MMSVNARHLSGGAVFFLGTQAIEPFPIPMRSGA